MKIRPEFQIYFAQLEEGGNWIAASNEEPFFCFEGESEEEVIQIARRAIELYERTDAPAPIIKSATVNVTRFSGGKIRKREELLAS